MTTELYKRYRPKTFKDVVGQDEIIASLKDLGKRDVIPHTILFTGPSGCGKTTIARILKKKLKCSDIDFTEVNSAECRGIDEVRKIKQNLNALPLNGECRIWLIDECHAMTGDAQNAFLKILEDTPDHVYFMLATTDPLKLKKTVITRCTEFKCKLLSEKNLVTLIKSIDEIENGPSVGNEDPEYLNDTVIKKIAEVADGSARKALVILHAVIGLESEEEQLAAIESSNIKRQAIEIARALMNEKTSWTKMTEILKNVKEEPESIRWMVLSYCKSVLLGKGNYKRAAVIVEEFRENWYDSKVAGLVISCYNIIHEN